MFRIHIQFLLFGFNHVLVYNSISLKAKIGKLQIWKVATWEIVTWEVAFGKIPNTKTIWGDLLYTTLKRVFN